jgi:hypothetical protein
LIFILNITKIKNNLIIVVVISMSSFIPTGRERAHVFLSMLYASKQSRHQNPQQHLAQQQSQQPQQQQQPQQPQQPQQQQQLHQTITFYSC